MSTTAWFILIGCLMLARGLGAILAPTDPVLATDVQLRHAGDSEQLRFILTIARGLARELADITLVVVIVSIVAHGLTVKPLLERYWRK